MNILRSKELTFKEGCDGCLMIFADGMRIGSLWNDKHKYELIMTVKEQEFEMTFRDKNQALKWIYVLSD
jgi:hypothetical protein